MEKIIFNALLYLIFGLLFACGNTSLAGDANADTDGYSDELEFEIEEELDEVNDDGDYLDFSEEEVEPPRYWSKEFDSTEILLGAKVIVTNDGGYLAIGSGRGVGLTKLDSDGNVIWSKMYDNFDGDLSIDSVVESETGELFVLINIISSTDPLHPNKTDNDTLLLKLDKNGEIIWQKNIGDSGVDLILTKDEHIILLAFVKNSDFNPPVAGDILIEKMNNEGDILWQKKYGNERSEELGSKILEDENGELWLFGSTNFYSDEGNVEPLVMKINSDSDIIKQKVFHGVVDTFNGNLLLLSDGGILLIADIEEVQYQHETLMMRLDRDMEIVWQKKLTVQNISASFPLSDGAFLLGGNSQFLNGNTSSVIIKISADGDLIWQRSYGMDGWDNIFSIEETENGEIVTGGSIINFYHKTWIMKLNSSGLISDDCPSQMGAETSFETLPVNLIPEESNFNCFEIDSHTYMGYLSATQLDKFELKTHCAG